MRTDTWIKIVVAMQVANFLAMGLLEQQRRTLWNNETAEIVRREQRTNDVKQMQDAFVGRFQVIEEQMKDLRVRTELVQLNSSKVDDVNSRLQKIQQDLYVLTNK